MWGIGPAEAGRQYIEARSIAGHQVLQMIGSNKGEEDVVLGNWRPDLMGRKYTKGSTTSRKVDDEMFRDQYNRGTFEWDLKLIISRKIERKERIKEREVEMSFGDYFILDPGLI